MKTLAAIRPLKEQVEAELLKRPGVTGVDIGYKYAQGKRTEDLAIRVYVAEKKDVPEKERIARTLKGIQTDVIERTFVLHPLRRPREDIVLMSDTGSYDPIVGGISIGPCRGIWLEPPDVPSAGWYIVGGTLGAVVKDKDTGATMFLSNFHVMCVDDAWSVGDTMTQPNLLDTGSCPGDIVGSLQRGQLGGTVDCAVCSHTARGYSCEIVDIGDVEGTATPTLGMAVRKRGRTTGLTYGTVDTLDLSVNINYGDGLGNVVLNHQIGVDVNPMLSTQFGDHGDSGAVVVNDARKVIGLHFAGNTSGTYGVANPIQDVLDALNVRMCSSKLLEKKWELKELEKKPELKEHFKLELKEQYWEHKNPKEIAELTQKEFVEVGPKSMNEGEPFIPIEPGQPLRPIEGRLAQLESTIRNLEGIGKQAGAMQCIDFSTYGWMVTPNPWTIGSVQFLALDHAGAGWPNPGVKNYGGLMGLDCGFRLQVAYAEPCRRVQLTLAHFSQPAKVEAYNTDGSIAGTAAMTSAGGVPETLTFSGSIRQVIVAAPQNETLLLKLCCEPSGGRATKDVSEKSTSEEKAGKKEKVEKLETKEMKDKPEKWESPELKGKREQKEFKEVEKLIKEKDFKEDVKDFAEGIPPGSFNRKSAPSTEERLTQIETAIAQLTHFIPPASRPDLSTGALRNEPEKQQH
ncbi:MAG: hypothetical protein JW846_10615 [Dehalococcoidia bacterium]|nr:hypothetical protein [Dehalococcoidia bacterium]